MGTLLGERRSARCCFCRGQVEWVPAWPFGRHWCASDPPGRERAARRPPHALLQGGYFLFTGIWPLVSRRTFEAVTGPKKDFWLAQTVGVLAPPWEACWR
jgi:hypothetical protein